MKYINYFKCIFHILHIFLNNIFYFNIKIFKYMFIIFKYFYFDFRGIASPWRGRDRSSSPRPEPVSAGAVPSVPSGSTLGPQGSTRRTVSKGKIGGKMGKMVEKCWKIEVFWKDLKRFVCMFFVMFHVFMYLF